MVLFPLTESGYYLECNTHEDNMILQVLYHLPIKSYHLYGKALVPGGTTGTEGYVTLKKDSMYFYELK